jgi:hypothetical protein
MNRKSMQKMRADREKAPIATHSAQRAAEDGKAEMCTLLI